jgi:hypothetical protein
METPTESAPSDTAPAPSDRTRPRHTIATVLLMALLSAGALYGVEWSVREQASPVHAWNFRSLPYEQSPWEFPAPRREQDDEGVTYLAIQTGPGPTLTMDLDTSTIRTVRATVEITRESNGEPVPYALEWYWASEDDIAAAGDNWPFSTERGTTFRLLDRHAPTIHTAQLSRHKTWKGSIAKAYIGVKIPPHEIGPFQIRTVHIEFLE